MFWPWLGVATKNGRAAPTYLLDIPELLEVVQAWDDIVREARPPDALWYARLFYSSLRGQLALAEPRPPDERRRNSVSRGIRELCKAAGQPYLSPHKLRHGFAVYAMKRARTMAEVKAISQNLMHADISVTTGVYGVLTGGDTQQIISHLGQADPTGSNGDAIALLEKLLHELKDTNKT